MAAYTHAQHIELKTSLQSYPTIGYHLSEIRSIERIKTKQAADSGESCKTCAYFTASSKCKMKGNKQVKSYNICQYHSCK